MSALLTPSEGEAMLALANEYERGLKKMLASGYEEFGAEVIENHRLVINALRASAQVATDKPSAGELLPCPFCGGKAVDRREVDGFPMIYCDGDDCFGPQTTARTFEDALLQWNTRHAPPANEGVLQGMTVALDEIIQRTINPTPTTMSDRRVLDWVNGKARGLYTTLSAALSQPQANAQGAASAEAKP